MKTCEVCRTEKSDEDFHRRKQSADGLQHYCKSCSAERNREWAIKHPARRRHINRRAHLRSKYGITPEAYAEMFAAQGGRCAACERTAGRRQLAVDHDHDTGEVRALLCGSCNSALGLLQESPAIIARLGGYITRFKSSTT